MTGPEKVAAARRVLEFAKANGFPNAGMPVWDADDAYYPRDCFDEIVEDSEHGEIKSAQMGIFFGNGSNVTVKRVQDGPDPGDWCAEVMP